MSVPTYDPAKVKCIVFEFPLSGFAKGTAIKIKRDEDTFKKYVGTGGEVSRVRNRNRTAQLEVTLAQTSICNDLLSAQLALDEKDGSGVGSMLIVDGGGRTTASALDAWIMGPPEVVFSDEIESRVWTIDLGDTLINIGGN